MQWHKKSEIEVYKFKRNKYNCIIANTIWLSLVKTKNNFWKIEKLVSIYRKIAEYKFNVQNSISSNKVELNIAIQKDFL